MLVLLQPGASEDDGQRLLGRLSRMGLAAQPVRSGRRLLGLRIDSTEPLDPERLECLPGVAQVVPLSPRHRLSLPGDPPRRQTVAVGPVSFGAGHPVLIAGPCAVESEDQMLHAARAVRDAGADLLRGGAFKPRTSPYSFQGLGPDGLRLLALAREATGLPVVSEALDERSLDLVAEQADMIQIGARNMQNFTLLRLAGRSGRPVLLKRGMSAGLEELLLAAEYVLGEGGPGVVLCERGVRGFGEHSRFLLDLSIVPAVRAASRLPIVVDPSHATGASALVAPLARAALAAGADGVMVEVHPAPDEALCDGPQALRPEEFAALAGELRALAATLATPAENLT